MATPILRAKLASSYAALAKLWAKSGREKKLLDIPWRIRGHGTPRTGESAEQTRSAEERESGGRSKGARALETKETRTRKRGTNGTGNVVAQNDPRK